MKKSINQQNSGSSFAICEICSGRDEWDKLPLFIYIHGSGGRGDDLSIIKTAGALDDVVYAEETIKMVRVINDWGGKAKITIWPNCNHFAWVPTFASDEIWEWLFSQKR